MHVHIFAYNADGLRVRKTVNGVITNYTLHGKNIVHLTQGSHSMHFFYDAQNRPAIVEWNNGTTTAKYGYIVNLQGDIVGIIDTTGTEVVKYVYDAWGKVLSTTGTLASTLGTIQPFRYRGYVYDVESGLYYLRSRYYDPDWGRFINEDCIFSSNAVFSENNLFTYCHNSPTMLFDPLGDSPIDDVCNFLCDVVEFVFPGSKERANKAWSQDATVYDWLNYLSLGYADNVKGAIAPEHPLSLQHWTDSFATIAIPYNVPVKLDQR